MMPGDRDDPMTRSYPELPSSWSAASASGVGSERSGPSVHRSCGSGFGLPAVRGEGITTPRPVASGTANGPISSDSSRSSGERSLGRVMPKSSSVRGPGQAWMFPARDRAGIHGHRPSLATLSSPERATGDHSVTDGTVIIIGGAEDKVRDRVILNRFVTLAGGRDATIVVISTASSLGTEAGERYRHIFTDLGVTTVRPIHAATRPQANDDSVAIALRDATGVFLTGGNQLKLASQVGGTRLADAMLERFRHGAVMAGTSAGASAMSSHMIAFGASGATPKHRMAQIAAGLGMLPGVIVDQHFQQRNRLGRLLSLIAQNPSLLGLGVDEDTAGVCGPGRDHGGDRPRQHHRRRRRRVRDRRLGGPRPQAADDLERRAPLAAVGLPLRPAPPAAAGDPDAPCDLRRGSRLELSGFLRTTWGAG